VYLRKKKKQRKKQRKKKKKLKTDKASEEWHIHKESHYPQDIRYHTPDSS
jgi:hypothetical protein